MDYEIRHEGLSDFTVRFRAVRDLSERVQEALRVSAQAAGSYMGTHVPFHSGDIYRAINIGPVRYMPGGAGGGGFWEVTVGVDSEKAPHVEYVMEGTGIYNRESPNPIEAHGNVMVFEKMGEGLIFAQSTSGQSPRREWFEDAADLANTLIKQFISTI